MTTTVAVLYGDLHAGDQARLAQKAAAAAVRALTGRDVPVTFRVRPGRRPLCRQGDQRVWVSWSHTRAGAVGAASTRPVGVDIEQCRHVRGAEGVDARLASTGLTGSAASCSVVSRWCVLEAAVKSLGTGFAVPLSRLHLGEGRVLLDGTSTGLRPTPVPIDHDTHPFHASVVHHGACPVVHPALLDGDQPFQLVRSRPGSTTRNKEEEMSAVLDKEELRTIVADTIDQDVEDVTDTASFVDDLEVDSLMALELVIVLERRYGVKFKEEMLPEVTSLQAAYELLSAEMAASA